MKFRNQAVQHRCVHGLMASCLTGSISPHRCCLLINRRKRGSTRVNYPHFLRRIPIQVSCAGASCICLAEPRFSHATLQHRRKQAAQANGDQRNHGCWSISHHGARAQEEDDYQAIQRWNAFSLLVASFPAKLGISALFCRRPITCLTCSLLPVCSETQASCQFRERRV